VNVIQTRRLFGRGVATALINQLRAILLERGIVVPQGRRNLEHELVMLMDEQQGADVGPPLLRLVGAPSLIEADAGHLGA
jgi:hypothetical protein